MEPFEVQLFRLGIVGSAGPERWISHSSTLWFHNVVYLFSPAEVRLTDIDMRETGDWDLIHGAIDDLSE